MRSRATAVLLVSVIACGSAPRGADPTPVVVPTAEHDAGSDASPTSVAPTPEADAGAALIAEPTPALPTGANGPRDALGMIGDAGGVVTGSPEALLLVNTAAIRDHAWGEDFRRAITGALVGWNQFMPFDLVHPTKDIDWMLLAGSIWLGYTQNNVFLSHHRVPEQRADAVFATLMQRLHGQKTNVGVAGTKSFSGIVDGADRAYLRPKPGVLAITPPADAKRVSELLTRVDVPATVRPGELFRVAYTGRSNGIVVLGFLPREITSTRAWVEATEDGATLHVEGDCADAEAAYAAAKTMKKTLAHQSHSVLVRLATNGILNRVVVWPDGATLRMKLVLQQRDIRIAAEIACMTSAPCNGP